jgi:proline iminopeptidase
MTRQVPREFRITVPGAELWAGALGSGPPIIVMHGGLGFDHTYLRRGLDPLASNHTVVYYDLRGSGRSRLTRPAGRFSFPEHVADLDAVREALGAEKIIVFAHSFGGRVAQEYALSHSDRVSGLVLCGIDTHFDYPGMVVANALKRSTPEQFAAVQRALSGPLVSDEEFSRIMRTILPLYYHDQRHLARGDYDFVQYRAAAFNAATFEGLGQFNSRPRLPQLTVPTLVIAGADDWITPLECATRPLADAIPGAQLAVFEKSGHAPFLEETDRFLEVMNGWLANLE